MPPAPVIDASRTHALEATEDPSIFECVVCGRQTDYATFYLLPEGIRHVVAMNPDLRLPVRPPAPAAGLVCTLRAGIVGVCDHPHRFWTIRPDTSWSDKGERSVLGAIG